MRKPLYRAMAPLVLALVPAGLVGQEEGERSSPELPPEAMQLIAELQQVQAELEPIQQEALTDPALQAAGEALAADVQEAMTDVDPETPERMERLQALMGEAQAAQAEQDADRMSEIVMEARGIEERLQAVQAQAVQRPEIATRIEEFQGRLEARMIEVDPDAGPLLERARDLNQRLAALLTPRGSEG